MQYHWTEVAKLLIVMAEDSLNGALSSDMRAAGKRPAVMFLGLRGIHSVQGGVETHVTHLVRNLPYAREDKVVIGRRPYRPVDFCGEEDAVVLWLPTFRNRHLEALIHSLVGTFYAAFRRPRILHIHGIGPGIVVPLARLFGLRVVTTHHGNDYDREKWGTFARSVLRYGERLAVNYANACISISPVVTNDLTTRYHKPVAYIPNGVPPRSSVPPSSQLHAMGLVHGRYIVNVARLVPEKRQIDLIDAFEHAAIPDIKLVFVGEADHASGYARAVRARAEANPNIIATGFMSGEPLAEIFCNAGLFVLPSAHEGLPLVLLEAMAYSLPLLVSDLPVYKAMGLSDSHQFPLGNIEALASRLRSIFATPSAPVDWQGMLRDYEWPTIARRTAEIYAQVLKD